MIRYMYVQMVPDLGQFSLQFFNLSGCKSDTHSVEKYTSNSEFLYSPGLAVSGTIQAYLRDSGGSIPQ